MASIKLAQHMWIERNLTNLETKQLCGWFVHNRRDEEGLPPSMMVTPVEESVIKRMAIPEKPIIKMTKQEYVDSFFEEGKLQLGSFEYYNNYDHNEIGDKQEGEIVLIGVGDNFTAAGKYAGGFDNYLLCTYQGDPDSETLEKFDYDSGFVIEDPQGFAAAIQKTIGAKSYEYASCVYSRHKALKGKLQPDFSIFRIDHRVIEMVSTARHFIKPDRFSHQNEFRFTWRMPHDVSGPLRIECPEAVQYCKRIIT